MDRKLIFAFTAFPVAFILTILLLKNPAPPTPQTLPLQTEMPVVLPKIEMISDKAELQFPTTDEWIVAKDGDEIALGTKIRTDKEGVVQIVFPDGTVTKVNRDTQITLADYSPKNLKINIESGKILSEIKDINYQSESGNLVISTNSGIYEHEYTKGKIDRILAIEKSLKLTCLKNNFTLDLTEGRKTSTSCKSQPLSTKAVFTPSGALPTAESTPSASPKSTAQPLDIEQTPEATQSANP